MKEILIQNVFGNFEIFTYVLQELLCFHRHIELSSSVTNIKFVFTTVPYGSMPQGKIGFNTLQVRHCEIFRIKIKHFYIISDDGLE
jgi:hypothetical protein